MGIRKKVALGFICLGLLLAGSAAVSLFELGRIGHRTRQILEAGNLNMAISHDLLDGAEMQNISFMHGFGTAAAGYDSLYFAGWRMFKGALERGRAEGIVAMDGIEQAFTDYENLTGHYFSAPEFFDRRWLKTDYWKTYTAMTAAIKEYMSGSESNLGIRASNIEHNAYRAITPSLVTTAVLMLLLFVLLYFIDLYYMRPVIAINRGIAGWLKFRSPFRAAVEGRDETLELKENVEKLIDLARKSDRVNP